MIYSISEEDEYIAGCNLLHFLARIKIEQAKFAYSQFLSINSEFERCDDCDKLPDSCNCNDDYPIYDRYHREYDDGDSYED